MMTPDSIKNKRFDKAMGGYRQDEVEAFLGQVSEEIRILQEEKENLEKKIQILGNKIEEYRADEDSLRSALIGAQKLGDSVVRDARAKAETILYEAKNEANRIVEAAQRSVEIEQTALTEMKKEVAKFKNRMLTMYRQHLDLITNLPEYAEKARIAETAPVQQTVEQTEVVNNVNNNEDFKPVVANVEKEQDTKKEDVVELDFSGMNENKEPVVEQPTMSFSEIPTPSSENSSKFGQLKFGEGFDVERDDKKGVFSRKKYR